MVFAKSSLQSRHRLIIINEAAPTRESIVSPCLPPNRTAVLQMTSCNTRHWPTSSEYYHPVDSANASRRPNRPPTKSTHPCTALFPSVYRVRARLAGMRRRCRHDGAASQLWLARRSSPHTSHIGGPASPTVNTAAQRPTQAKAFRI